MKTYEVRYQFKVKAKDRFDAARKIDKFLPQTDDVVQSFHIIAVKPETSKENCEGCDDFDTWGCVYQFINNGECRRETLSKPILSGTHMVEEYKKSKNLNTSDKTYPI
jgi:hypothetical protein